MWEKTDTTPILLSATLSSRDSPSKASAGREALCVREAENQSAVFSMNYELDNREASHRHTCGGASGWKLASEIVCEGLS